MPEQCTDTSTNPHAKIATAKHPAIVALAACLIPCGTADAADDRRPHAVIVVGTLHYSPELTMPVFAKELERFHFRTTIVMGEGNPRRKPMTCCPGSKYLPMPTWRSFSCDF